MLVRVRVVEANPREGNFELQRGQVEESDVVIFRSGSYVDVQVSLMRLRHTKEEGFELLV